MPRKKQVEYGICASCKASFPKKRSWQKACSPKCSQKLRHERHSERHSGTIVPDAHFPGSKRALTGHNGVQNLQKMAFKTGENPRYETLLVRGPNGRKWGRNPNQITAEMLEAEGIKKTPLLAVMRAMCLDCRPPEEVLVCARPYCPLWPYRDGASPWKRGDD